ncbi:type II toxin-antitoxin system RelE/ParE family toxin [Candidatus Parcubacteria bacterium]|nr:type II toxin-antitoxin system RelE/ParE family toxin [Candidatus Parcubacteria bacterium]
MFEVQLTKRAEREFNRLPNNLKQKFYNEFKKLSVDIFEHPQVRKIQDTEFGYRLRIGRWRILFALFSKEKRIEIVDIFIEKGKDDYRKRRKLL